MSQPKQSLFDGAPDIRPVRLSESITVSDLVEQLGGTCFEARVLRRGARLWKRMIDDGCAIWLGIAGAGIAGGLGGLVIQLIQRGYLDVICTTGAQAYHDLHFAFDLPVKAIPPEVDDDRLRRHGDTRIYDIAIRDEETLVAQDAILCRFMEERRTELTAGPLSSPDFMQLLGEWVDEAAPHPEESFVVAATRAQVPIFWDSNTNHSIALNAARMELQGLKIDFSAQADILESAALAYYGSEVGFVELGGGGPKNFIQQTGPTISQILDLPHYEGASRGLQITTANVREGSLSSCTFAEAVSWGKYEQVDQHRLVQIWGEYSILFPLLVAYVLDRCEPREPKRYQSELTGMRQRLEERWK